MSEHTQVHKMRYNIFLICLISARRSLIISVLCCSSLYAATQDTSEHICGWPVCFNNGFSLLLLPAKVMDFGLPRSLRFALCHGPTD